MKFFFVVLFAVVASVSSLKFSDGQTGSVTWTSHHAPTSAGTSCILNSPVFAPKRNEIIVASCADGAATVWGVDVKTGDITWSEDFGSAADPDQILGMTIDENQSLLLVLTSNYATVNAIDVSGPPGSYPAPRGAFRGPKDQLVSITGGLISRSNVFGYVDISKSSLVFRSMPSGAVVSQFTAPFSMWKDVTSWVQPLFINNIENADLHAIVALRYQYPQYGCCYSMLARVDVNSGTFVWNSTNVTDSVFVSPVVSTDESKVYVLTNGIVNLSATSKLLSVDATTGRILNSLDTSGKAILSATAPVADPSNANVVYLLVNTGTSSDPSAGVAMVDMSIGKIMWEYTFVSIITDLAQMTISSRSGFSGPHLAVAGSDGVEVVDLSNRKTVGVFDIQGAGGFSARPGSPAWISAENLAFTSTVDPYTVVAARVN